MTINAYFLLGVLFIVTVAFIAGRMDHDDAVEGQRQYCEMVEIYDRSGGEYGWPPYRGREICN